MGFRLHTVASRSFQEQHPRKLNFYPSSALDPFVCMWMYTHFSWMVMISLHYRHHWSLPSLYHCFSEMKACEWSRRRSAPLLPFSWLAGAPASFVRKRLLSRHSRRSLEVRNFIPCLMKRDVELWLQPAGRGTVGRGVSVCSVEQVISGNKPAA